MLSNISGWLQIVFITIVTAAPASYSPHPNCRDRFIWPFNSSSIWNTAIGSQVSLSLCSIEKGVVCDNNSSSSSYTSAGSPAPESAG